jgi:hypothetical protein
MNAFVAELDGVSLRTAVYIMPKAEVGWLGLACRLGIYDTTKLTPIMEITPLTLMI